MELQFNINGQIISRADNKIVVADSRKYISLKFTFTDEWQDTNKTAVITTNNITYYALINSDGIVNADDMPIIKSGLCYFSVFGGDTQAASKLQTANELFIDVVPSGLKDGEFPEPPPEEVYQQIYNKAQSAEDKAQSVVDMAENGEFDGHTPIKGTDYFTAEEIQEIAESVDLSSLLKKDQTTPQTTTGFFNLDKLRVGIETDDGSSVNAQFYSETVIRTCPNVEGVYSNPALPVATEAVQKSITLAVIDITSGSFPSTYIDCYLYPYKIASDNTKVVAQQSGTSIDGNEFTNFSIDIVWPENTDNDGYILSYYSYSENYVYFKDVGNIYSYKITGDTTGWEADAWQLVNNMSPYYISTGNLYYQNLWNVYAYMSTDGVRVYSANEVSVEEDVYDAGYKTALSWDDINADGYVVCNIYAEKYYDVGNVLTFEDNGDYSNWENGIFVPDIRSPFTFKADDIAHFYSDTNKVAIKNNGQIVSDLETGTKPFDIQSSTKVDNLNADLLDGLHADDFAKALGIDDNYVTDDEKATIGKISKSLLYEVIEAPYPSGIPSVIEGNKIQLIGHPFLNDDFIEFSAGEGTLPTEIYNKSFWIYSHSKLTFYNRAFYFVVNKTDNDFQISDTKGGVPVTISLTGENFKVRLAGSKRSAFFSFTKSTELIVSIRGAAYNPTGSSNGGLALLFYDGYSNLPGMQYKANSTWWSQGVITTGINGGANQFCEFCLDYTVKKDTNTRFYNGDYKAYVLYSTTFGSGVTPTAGTSYGKFKLTNYFSSYYETISRIQLRTEMGDSATNIFLNGTIVEVTGG